MKYINQLNALLVAVGALIVAYTFSETFWKPPPPASPLVLETPVVRQIARPSPALPALPPEQPEAAAPEVGQEPSRLLPSPGSASASEEPTPAGPPAPPGREDPPLTETAPGPGFGTMGRPQVIRAGESPQAPSGASPAGSEAPAARVDPAGPQAGPSSGPPRRPAGRLEIEGNPAAAPDAAKRQSPDQPPPPPRRASMPEQRLPR